MASASPPPPQAVPAEPWRILRWRSRHLAHREQLAKGVALTMLRIPAGSFLVPVQGSGLLTANFSPVELLTEA